ncbi:MAG: hypothetical protein GXP31_00305 [Kiritimatiellaeota bacterium]|nr:hypothetical protein [Kiritimatiellota bacterium]
MFSAAERVERFRRFYRRENSRPLLGFFLGSEYPLKRYPSAATLPADHPLVPADFEPRALAADSARLFVDHEACGGDFIWSGTAFWGVPWLEAALGCPLYADPVGGSISTRPPANFIAAGELPEFEPQSPWIRLAARCFEALTLHGGGPSWPVGTTRMRGISDLLSALYGPEEFVLTMLDRPREIEAVCERLTRFWIAFARCQSEWIPAFHGGVGSFYYNAWAPAGTVWGQEDAAALLSPGLFDHFIRPCIERMVRALPHVIVHLHPSGYIPVAPLLELGVSALELHVDVGGPGTEALIPLQKRILERSPLFISGRLTAVEIRRLFDVLPGQGLAVQAMVDTPQEAWRLWRNVFG